MDTKLALTFAESTIYTKTKRSRADKSYISNIHVVYTGYMGVSTHRLYEIYYNHGNHLWALCKSPYTKNPWDRPKWYRSAEVALEKAYYYYNTEDFSCDTLVEKHTAAITWFKKTGDGRLDFEMVREKTTYSTNPL